MFISLTVSVCLFFFFSHFYFCLCFLFNFSLWMLSSIQPLLVFSPQFNLKLHLFSPLTYVILQHKQRYSVSSKFRTRKMQGFDYFLVLDFEATCDNEKKVVPQVNNFFSFFLMRKRHEMDHFYCPNYIKSNQSHTSNQNLKI